MIAATTLLSAGPLILAVWVLESYLLLALIRLALDRFSSERAERLCSALQQLTDRVPDMVDVWLTMKRGGDHPTWAPWTIVICGAVVIRYLLVVAILAL